MAASRARGRDGTGEMSGGGKGAMVGGGGDEPPPVEEEQAFRFEARRSRLDWRLLHSIDVDRVMRENDIDALESTLAGTHPRGAPRPLSILTTPLPTTKLDIGFRYFLFFNDTFYTTLDAREVHAAIMVSPRSASKKFRA